MPNMSLKKNEMPAQPPEIRAKNFLEVATGYTKEQAIDEAKRCLNCKNKPCVGGCPVQIDIPAFIAKVAEGDFQGAYDVIYKSSSLPAVCGRVCPQESQCEGKCVRGIKGEPVAIGRLERFVFYVLRSADNFFGSFILFIFLHNEIPPKILFYNQEAPAARRCLI